MTNQEHLDLLTRGAMTWNAWKATQAPDFVADLSNVFLPAHFWECSFTQANLGNAALWKSNFTQTNLSRANLSEATFIQVTLKDVDLNDATLTGADFIDRTR